MNGFTEFVARLKAWQVFIFLMLPMFASQFYLMSNMPSHTSAPQPPSIEEFEALFKQAMLMSLLMVVLLLGWLLSIGFAANRRVEQNIRLNTRLAVGCAIYAASYIALAQFIFPGPGSSSSDGVWMGLIIPLHLLSMFGIFYVLAFKPSLDKMRPNDYVMVHNYHTCVSTDIPDQDQHQLPQFRVSVE